MDQRLVLSQRWALLGRGLKGRFPDQPELEALLERIDTSKSLDHKIQDAKLLLPFLPRIVLEIWRAFRRKE